jgi:hypothetical protein
MVAVDESGERPINHALDVAFVSVRFRSRDLVTAGVRGHQIPILR